MNLENKIEAQRKRMEQEKNKLDMLMKKAKIDQRKADNHRKIVVGANFETFLNEPRSRPDGLCRWHLPQKRSRTAWSRLSGNLQGRRSRQVREQNRDKKHENTI